MAGAAGDVGLVLFEGCCCSCWAGVTGCFVDLDGALAGVLVDALTLLLVLGCVFAGGLEAVVLVEDEVEGAGDADVRAPEAFLTRCRNSLPILLL